MPKREAIILLLVTAAMAAYFLVAQPVMMDDGFQYEGFAEALAHGKIDFKSFYGFQGLSILAAPVHLATGSSVSIIITSAILSLASVILAYLIGRDLYGSRRAGMYFLSLFLLTPYPYVTMMRGFQEAALLFLVLLVIYGSIGRKAWTPFAWAFGGIVKPFALTLAPLFLNKQAIARTGAKKFAFLFILSICIGAAYLAVNFHQTGHLVNNAAINSYQQGSFDTGNPPPLGESFVVGVKGFLRVAANFLIASRKVMVSPFVILLGAMYLVFGKAVKMRREMIAAVVLNIILVGCLTFSFSKYLLPAVALLSLAAIPLLVANRWLLLVVLADSLTVFIPIFDYFGKGFWPHLWVFLIPFYLAAGVLALDLFLTRTNRPVKYADGR